MNYKNIATRTLVEFLEKSPNMTFGEVLYSFLREKNSGVNSISDIKTISDETCYSIIEKAKQFEEE